jgi:hypothetical protein
MNRDGSNSHRQTKTIIQRCPYKYHAKKKMLPNRYVHNRMLPENWYVTCSNTDFITVYIRFGNRVLQIHAVYNPIPAK